MNSKSSFRVVETTVSRAFVEQAIAEKLYQFKMVAPGDKILKMSFGERSLENILDTEAGGNYPIVLELKKEQEVRVTKT